jgi:hypothetical protein
VPLIAEVIGQLDLERSLHQTLRQLRQQPAGPDDLLLAAGPRQELIDNVVRQLSADVIRHAAKHPRRGRRQLAWRLAAGAIQNRIWLTEIGLLLFC